jgi:hypothetical protein
MPNRNYLVFEAVGPGVDGSHSDPLSDINYVVRADEDTETGGKASHKPGRHSERHSHSILGWAQTNYSFDKKRGYPSTLGPTSRKDGTGVDGDPLHKHGHSFFCHHRKSRHLNPSLKPVDATKHEDGTRKSVDERMQAARHPVGAATGLRVRFWLESRVKEAEGRQFSRSVVRCTAMCMQLTARHSYEVVVPNLELKEREVAKPTANGVAATSNGHVPVAAPHTQSNGQVVAHEFMDVNAPSTEVAVRA